MRAGSRCASTATLWPLRTASCAAAMLSSRPMVIGATVPGNKATLRTGTIGIASAGRDGSSIVGFEPALGISAAMVILL